MKNTKIYLWIDPMVMNHKRCAENERHHFNCILDGKLDLDTEFLDEYLGGSIMDGIMDFANIDSNWNYGVISASYTNESAKIEFTKSPDEIKTENKIAKFVKSNKDVELTKKNVTIAGDDGDTHMKNGIIKINYSAFNIKEEIDFGKMWAEIEKHIMPNIKEGDTAVITDENGEEIISVMGGSFLNIGHTDLKIYDAKKIAKNQSMFNDMQGLKGGLYIRDDGSLDIGDINRTFLISIKTNKLLKSSLKLKLKINELTNKLMLNYKPKEK